jgi:hypothetical protein
VRLGHRHTPGKEWGRKRRKEEDRLRGLNGKADREAIDEAMRELELIEWANGGGPMPAHLVEAGTVRREFRRGVRLLNPHVGWCLSEASTAPVGISQFEEFELERPYYEVYVWGVLVERGPLSSPSSTPTSSPTPSCAEPA